MRDALLETAIDHFGRLGFEGAATRAIARDSGTAMSSITYHFGGKQGLYLAAAEHIAAQIEALHRVDIERVEAQRPATREEAVEAMVTLIDRLAAIMLSDASARWARFVIREQQEPTEAFDRIYRIAMQPMVDCLVPLIALARPDMDEREARATGFLLVGQTLALRAARASLARILDCAPIDEAAEQLIRARARAHTRCILAAPPETDR